MNKVEFYIESTYPSHGSVDFRINDIIKIKFVYHMQTETVKDTNRIQLLSDEEVVATTNKYNPITKTLEILPREPLEFKQDYIVRIYSGKEGPLTVRGEQLAQDATYVFTTERNPNPEVDMPEDPEEEPKEEATEEDVGSNELADSHSGLRVLSDPFVSQSNYFVLEDSYPKSGDLLEIDVDMVFVFSSTVSTESFEKNVFIKKSSINKLTESIQGVNLIKGTARTNDESNNSKQIIFTPSQHLETGQEYELVIKNTIHPDMSNDYRIVFHTLFDRMFADVSTVRLVLGRFADRLTDLDLAKLINQQSNSIYQLASMMNTFNESDWAEESGVMLTFPYAASQYVVYSTAYYAILGQSLETSSGISETIRLADLSVSGSNEVSDSLGDLLDVLKKEIDRWWNVLQGEAEEIEPGQPNPNYSMGITTRAGATSPYPEFHIRVPFQDIGGGG